MARYHDEEWGVRVRDDVELFERLALESFQAGLSWSTILRKRVAFRSAFRDFEPAVVASFGAADVERFQDETDPGTRIFIKQLVEMHTANLRQESQHMQAIGDLCDMLDAMVQPTEQAYPAGDPS